MKKIKKYEFFICLLFGCVFLVCKFGFEDLFIVIILVFFYVGMKEIVGNEINLILFEDRL